MTPQTTRLALASCAFSADVGHRVAQPNKRLKLAGALGLKEAVGSCPCGYRLTPSNLAPAGESPAA